MRTIAPLPLRRLIRLVIDTTTEDRSRNLLTTRLGGGITVFTASNAIPISNNVLNLALVPPPDKLGVFTNGSWFLDRNGDLAFDPATEIIGWGLPGDAPVVGDWDGDGKDAVGVFSGGTWFIDRNGDGVFDPATEAKGWGVAGWTPIAGGWR